MKGLRLFLTVLGVFLGVQAWAQTDLSIVTSDTLYQFSGDGQENFITYEFDNFGPNSASGGVTVTFTKDMFVDPSFDFSSVNTGDFNCNPNGDSMVCDLLPTSFDPFTPVFIDLGVIIQPGDFDLAPAFSVNINDQSGQDSDLSNNSLFVDLEYTAGGALDFQVTLLNPTQPIQYPAGSGTQTMDFEIRNLGPLAEGDQTTVTFDISPDLDPQFANPASATSSDPAWSCFAVTGQVICDYAAIFDPFTASVINLTIPVPDNVPVPATINNAVGVSMFNVLGDSDPSNNTFQYPIEIITAGSAEIEVVKSVVGNLTQIIQGEQLEYIIDVNNTGAGVASNVDIVDALPVGVTYQSHSELGPNFTCSFANNTVSCNAPNLPVTASQDGVSIIVTADGPIGAGVTNTASSTFLDSNPSDNTSAVFFNIIAPVADLDITMTTDSANYLVGDLITHDLTLHNPVTSNAAPENAELSVVLSPESVFVNAQETSGIGFNCVHDGSPAGGVVTCDSQGNALPIGTNTLFEITAVADAPTPATSSQADASITSDFDSNPTNDTASAFFFINAAVADFSINKTVSGTNFAVGDTFTYVLTINNPVPSTASPTDVEISDQLPNELSYDSFIVGTALGTNINCNHDGANNGGLLTCNTGGAPFPPGETVTIDVNVTAAVASNNINNTATAETVVDADGVTNNNSATAPTVIVTGPSLTTVSATKTAQVAGLAVTQVGYGQNFEYLLVVENTGFNDAVNVQVTDTLPAEVSLVNVLSNGWTCNAVQVRAGDFGNSDVDCVLDTVLAAGATAQIVVEVVATNNTSITSITNQMEVNADNIGPQVIDQVTVGLLNPQAALNLSQNPSPVDPEGDVEFGLLIENNGTVDLNGLQLVSQLPTGFTYNGFITNDGWACNENAGTLTCTLTATLASASSTSLNIEATAPIPQANQTYQLNSTLSANELPADVNASLTVAFSTSDFALNIQSNPGEVQVGTPFKHLISLNNTGNFDLVDVNLAYANSDSATVTGLVVPGFVCNEISNAYQCSNSDPLATNTLVQAEVTLVAQQAGSLVSGNVSVTADGIGKSVTTTTVVQSDIENDLALSQTVSATQVETNNPFDIQLEVTNLGQNPQSGFSVTDELPQGVVFQRAVGTNWNCAGTAVISCDFSGTLESNQSTQLTFELVAPDSAGLISNTATLVVNNDDNPANNSSTANINVAVGTGGAARADLALDVIVSGNDVLSTDQLVWTINIQNFGPDTAENVSLFNALPNGFIAESVEVSNGAECVLLATSLQCDIVSLASEASSTVRLEGSFMNGFEGVLLNTFEVSSDAIDPDASNNISNNEITVTSVENLQADLGLALSVSNQAVQQGDVFELSFNAMNMGPDRAINARIEGGLSGLVDSLQFLNTSGWACQASGNNFICSFPGEFTVGMSSMIDLRVSTQQVVQQSQPLVFNANISSDAMDSQPGNNIIGFTNEVTRTPTEDEIFSRFQTAVGSSASETVIQSIRNVSSYCARSYFSAIEGLCEEFIEDATPENGADIINAMEELTPNEVAAQSNSAAEIITSQFRNVGSRLAQLRGGGGSGFSVAGLNARYGNESLPLGMLAYLNQSEEEQQAVSNINDFVSPWGFFVNGSISMGERDATGRELGFDFDTFGLTAGVDYRFSATKVAGLALGYANFDSEIEGEAEMQSTGFTLTGYGSFYLRDNFYVDGRLSYGNPDFEQKRRINFSVDEIVIDRVASGDTDADQYSVAMSAGYHFNKNSWVITPNASMRYVKTTIDAFQETGAGGFNFAFGEQEVTSMVWSVGASVSKAISLKNGIISPQFDFNFSRETENDGGLLEARFIDAPDDEIFFIGTDEPDRTFGSAGIGLVFIGANGKQAYINYRSIFGLDGFTRGTINIGARFEF
ncbi:autotransporter domain-containing protein [Marinicella sp. S1101]|uniref:autotransporter domain-containing protein n=1 Tax=Marinicella marina TaxID=2996016 RepID=UPI002260F7A0|nr:autotransporter domain-containing protein [Marinicella marina]MCX7554676.1 autotransporter domain-containing protein [Marinicella marina]MDJ1140741.1 autotransporter domain-containing protein [Marinicella marina]